MNECRKSQGKAEPLVLRALGVGSQQRGGSACFPLSSLTVTKKDGLIKEIRTYRRESTRYINNLQLQDKDWMRLGK